jgi:hypothetical protein
MSGRLGEPVWELILVSSMKTTVDSNAKPIPKKGLRKAVNAVTVGIFLSCAPDNPFMALRQVAHIISLSTCGNMNNAKSLLSEKSLKPLNQE